MCLTFLSHYHSTAGIQPTLVQFLMSKPINNCALFCSRFVAGKQEEHYRSQAQSAQSARLDALHHLHETAASMAQARAALQPGPGEHRAEGSRYAASQLASGLKGMTSFAMLSFCCLFSNELLVCLLMRVLPACCLPACCSFDNQTY